MAVAPFSVPDVLSFFGHHRWMAAYELDRAEGLYAGSYEGCRRLAVERMAVVREHEPQAFDAIMRVHAPQGYGSLEGFFWDWTRPQLGRFLEAVENRVTLERFGVRSRDLRWPWDWREKLTPDELSPLLDRLLAELKMLIHDWDAARWPAAYFMAMAVYPDRFAFRRAESGSPAWTLSGLRLRVRGRDEGGVYKIWLVLEGRRVPAVLDLADDAPFGNGSANSSRN